MKSLMLVVCLILGATEGRAGDSLFYYSDMEGHYFPDRNFGDANCSGGLNVADITLLVNYLFQGGPPPAKPCMEFLPG